MASTDAFKPREAVLYIITLALRNHGIPSLDYIMVEQEAQTYMYTTALVFKGASTIYTVTTDFPPEFGNIDQLWDAIQEQLPELSL